MASLHAMLPPWGPAAYISLPLVNDLQIDVVESIDFCHSLTGGGMKGHQHQLVLWKRTKSVPQMALDPWLPPGKNEMGGCGAESVPEAFRKGIRMAALGRCCLLDVCLAVVLDPWPACLPASPDPSLIQFVPWLGLQEMPTLKSGMKLAQPLASLT